MTQSNDSRASDRAPARATRRGLLQGKSPGRMTGYAAAGRKTVVKTYGSRLPVSGQRPEGEA